MIKKVIKKKILPTHPNCFEYVTPTHTQRQTCVNGVKVYQFKAKDSKIKPYALCLGNISKDVTVNSMKITRLNGHVHDFFIDYNTTVSDTGYIHECLIKKHNTK